MAESVTDLVEFLRARVDEDEQVAQTTLKNEQRVPGTDRWFSSHSNAITSMAPHRAVVEVEAKRRMLNELYPEVKAADESIEGEWNSNPYNADALLELLALPYADHPDYREEWKR